MDKTIAAIEAIQSAPEGTDPFELHRLGDEAAGEKLFSTRPEVSDAINEHRARYRRSIIAKMSPDVLPTNTTGKLTRVPWSSVGDDVSFAVGDTLKLFRSGDFDIRTVKPSPEWIATQGYLHEGDFPVRDFDKATATKAFKDNHDMPPTLVRAGGKTFIIDGHHRFATALRKGETVKAAYIDFDKSEPSSKKGDDVALSVGHQGKHEIVSLSPESVEMIRKLEPALGPHPDSTAPVPKPLALFGDHRVVFDVGGVQVVKGQPNLSIFHRDPKTGEVEVRGLTKSELAAYNKLVAQKKKVH